MAKPVGTLATNFGALGVQLFFIVSGYTMMLTFGHQVSRENVRNFYVRRAFRIAPPFWLAVALYLLLDGLAPRFWAPSGLSPLDVGLTLAFLQWASPTAFNSVVPGGWSIAVEMQFYALFPLMFWLMLRRRGPLIVALGTAAVYVGATALAKAFLIPAMEHGLPAASKYLAYWFFYFWLPRQMVCFAFGMLLHEELSGRAPGALPFLVLAGAAMFTDWGREVVFLSMLSFFVLRTRPSGRLIASVGENSYSMYLTHFAVIAGVVAASRIANHPAPFEIAYPLVCAIAWAVSNYVTGPYVEKPAQRAAKALIRRAWGDGASHTPPQSHTEDGHPKPAQG